MNIVGEGLTFDDVLLLPNYSDVVPSDVLEGLQQSAMTYTRRSLGLTAELFWMSTSTVPSLARLASSAVSRANVPVAGTQSAPTLPTLPSGCPSTVTIAVSEKPKSPSATTSSVPPASGGSGRTRAWLVAAPVVE